MVGIVGHLVCLDTQKQFLMSSSFSIFCAFLVEGRAEKDPSEFWYKGEIGFFDFYM